MEENILIRELKQLASITSGIQKKWYEDMITNAKPVKVVSVYDVFSKEEVANIKRIIKPKKKQCYRNAFDFANKFDNVIYCEGRVTLFEGGGFGIDHAFNKVGDKYVDITMELVLNKDVTKETYISIGEYDNTIVNRIALQTKYYGGVYNELYIEQLNK